MIKRNIRPLLAAMLLAGSVGAANAAGYYAGGSIGGSDWKDSVDGVRGSSSGVTGKVFGGYEFSPNFSLEAGGMDLGHMRDGTGKASSAGGFFDAVGRYELNPRWSVLGRAGLVRARFSTPDGDSTSNGLKLGAGVQYELTPQIALRGEYEHYHFTNVFDSKVSTGQFTAGFKFSF
jgi:OOP family OmpA-OmpF porin